MRTRKLLWFAVLSAVISAAIPNAALACATCFGKSDAPMAQGMNMGMFTLLGVLGVVMAGAITFFVVLARRASANSEADESANSCQ